MRKKINLTDIVVYNKKKRRTRRDIDEVVKKTDEQQAGVNQLTDQDGFDRSYCADNDVAVIDNTVYIAGTYMNTASTWYADFVKVPTLWNAVPITINRKILYVWNESSTKYRGLSKDGN